MSEKYVQVPVSLIERTAAEYERDGWHLAAEKWRALLSQATPTSAPIDFKRFNDGASTVIPESALQTPATDLDGNTTEPPRIEDMAPGTTFTAKGQRFMRIHTASGLDWAPTLVSDAGEFAGAADIDPSTIRDVTPPKDAA